MARPRTRALATGLALALVVSLAPSAVRGEPSEPSPESTRLLQALEEAFVAVARRAMPAVVNVSVKARRPDPEEGPSEEEQRFRDFFGPELFERFFRRRVPREEPRAAGSGVIVDAEGHILTNDHVVENALEIEVRLSDDRRFKARLIGRDQKTDLAVLRVEAPAGSLPVAELGDSSRLRVGQWAIAIGNPFGLDRTVTVGIVSATGRTRVGVATYEAFIQTDASINPGNSGGPLLDLGGRVIGINTAIVATGQGIGFSIPINMAREIMTQLVARGRVVRGWLGVVIQDLTEDLAAGFGVPPDGVLVSDVVRDGPAETAGLRAGDIIVEVAGEPIGEVTDLQKRVAAVVPGTEVGVVVMRDRARTPLTVRVGEQPVEGTLAVGPLREESLGLTVEPLTAEVAERLGITAKAGVVVTRVAPGSSGEAAGIRPGDAILEVDRRPVTSVAGFRRIMDGLQAGALVPVQIQRGGGGNSYVVLKAPDAKP